MIQQTPEAQGPGQPGQVKPGESSGLHRWEQRQGFLRGPRRPAFGVPARLGREGGGSRWTCPRASLPTLCPLLETGPLGLSLYLGAARPISRESVDEDRPAVYAVGQALRGPRGRAGGCTSTGRQMALQK